MNDEHGREIIPGGRHRRPHWLHLGPVIRFLVEERGHMILEERERWGFVSMNGGLECGLTRHITDEDWAAINERFALPSNIGWLDGLIRDNDNRLDIIGYDSLKGVNGVEPIEVFEEELRRTGEGTCPELDEVYPYSWMKNPPAPYRRAHREWGPNRIA